MTFASLVASQLGFDRVAPERYQNHPRGLFVAPSTVDPAEACAAVFMELSNACPARGIHRHASGTRLDVVGGGTSPLLEVRHVRDNLVGNRLDIVFVWVEERDGAKEPSMLDPWWRHTVTGRLVPDYSVVMLGASWGVLGGP